LSHPSSVETMFFASSVALGLIMFFCVASTILSFKGLSIFDLLDCEALTSNKNPPHDGCFIYRDDCDM